VDRGAARARGDACLAQNGDRLALAERAFDRSQLAVDLRERGQLREYQRVVALPEAMQVEHQPAEVAIGELTCLAQEARTAACATARLESSRRGWVGSIRGRRVDDSILYLR